MIRVATGSERKILGAHPRRNRTELSLLVTPCSLSGKGSRCELSLEFSTGQDTYFGFTTTQQCHYHYQNHPQSSR